VQQVHQAMWRPEYPQIELTKANISKWTGQAVM
jgi:hypothetical protein